MGLSVISPVPVCNPIENLAMSSMFVCETTALYTPDLYPFKSKVIWPLPAEFVLTVSVSLILSLKSIIWTVRVVDEGPTTRKVKSLIVWKWTKIDVRNGGIDQLV